MAGNCPDKPPAKVCRSFVIIIRPPLKITALILKASLVYKGRSLLSRSRPEKAIPMSQEPNPWQNRPQGSLPPDWAKEIDEYEAQIALNKQGKIEPRIF